MELSNVKMTHRHLHAWCAYAIFGVVLALALPDTGSPVQVIELAARLVELSPSLRRLVAISTTPQAAVLWWAFMVAMWPVTILAAGPYCERSECVHLFSRAWSRSKLAAIIGLPLLLLTMALFFSVALANLTPKMSHGHGQLLTSFMTKSRIGLGLVGVLSLSTAGILVTFTTSFVRGACEYIKNPGK
jgi:hypothetical protein